jgi:tRNA dimethylallyltransferase
MVEAKRDDSPSIIVVIGPTASGKSALGLQIAKSLGSSVLSVDSLQVYRNFGVVSDKITSHEMQGITHFGIDIVEPTSELDVSRYLQYAIDIISNELDEGRSPVVVGGTNMYVEKLLFTSRLDNESDCPQCPERFPSGSRGYSHEDLAKLDPVMATRLHPNDRKRVARAIDYFYDSGGKRLSESLQQQKRELRWENVVVIMKEPLSQSDLDVQIRNRIMEKMIKTGGLMRELDEIAKLVADKKLQWNKGLLQAIGYREFEAFVAELNETGNNNMDLFNQALDEVIRNTVRYSKKQQKWIKKIGQYLELIHVKEFTPDLISKIREAGPIKVKSMPQWGKLDDS